MVPPTTVSIGLSTFRTPVPSEVAHRYVDELLYEAKKTRNHVIAKPYDDKLPR